MSDDTVDDALSFTTCQPPTSDNPGRHLSQKDCHPSDLYETW